MKLKYNQRIVFVSGGKDMVGRIVEFDGIGRPFVEVVTEKNTKSKGLPKLVREITHYRPELKDIVEVL